MRLSFGNQAALVATDGGRVMSYAVQGREVLASDDARGDAYRSVLLAPWPNRVTAGRWTWQGREHHLPVNEPQRDAALHGLVADAAFRVVECGADHVTLVHDLVPSRGYPFALQVTAVYRLSAQGLRCRLTATNTGDAPAPVALGVHPYLDCRGPVDAVLLSIPANQVLELDACWEERARVGVTATTADWRIPTAVGAQALDHCWTDLVQDDHGTVRCQVVLPGGDEVELWAGGTCRYVVAYTADALPGGLRRASLALEPYTAPPNALRSGTDLSVLAPRESLSLDWGLRPSWIEQETSA